MGVTFFSKGGRGGRGRRRGREGGDCRRKMRKCTWDITFLLRGLFVCKAEVVVAAVAAKT